MKETHKLRILINSNAPWSTSGYGTQVRDLLPRIRDAGYPIACTAYYGLEGGKLIIDGVKYYPKMGDVWGADAMFFHSQDFKADLIFTHQDVWVLNMDLISKLNRWIPLVPIDHDPVPEAVFQRLKSAYRVVTYSQFGRDELKRNGMHSTYIPLTVDTSELKPMNKQEAKKKIGIPQDLFLFGMIAANKDNPPRKSFQEAMDAFKLFHTAHPKSGIYFHTLTQQQGGFPIEEYAKFLGISDSVYHLQPYEQMYMVDREGLKTIYNAFDCLLAPSTNEGFGVPIIEAQSCGVPVITNNFTSMPELVKPGITGELCTVAYKRFTPLLSYIGIPDVTSIYDSMERIYRADQTAMAKAARRHIIKHYDSSTIFNEKWLPYLAMLENEIYPKT